MKHFELTDDVWGRLEAVLKSDKSTWRGKSENKRLFVEGVLSLLKDKKEFSTSLNWKNLNPKYGNSLSQCRTFNRWRDNGVWDKLLPVFASRANYSWVTTLGTYEVLLKNGKYLSEINKAIQEDYMWAQEELKEDIYSKNLEMEQLQQIINEKNHTIQELNNNIELLARGTYTNAVVKKMKEQIKKLDKECEIYRIENFDLKRFNEKYIRKLYMVYNYEARGHGSRGDQGYIRNFWSIAQKLRKEKERRQAQEQAQDSK